jgi:phosphonate transport system substrate-binding protein
VGCLATEPQIVIQTRVVEKEATREVVREVTRLVREVVTATPAHPSPTPPPTIRLYASPAFCAHAGVAAFQELADLLAKRTGFRFEVVMPESEAQVVEALCGGQADLAWMSIAGYLMANKACAAEARFTVAYQGSASRRAQIMMQSAKARQARGLAPIESLGDINGKVFAFTDPLSATGYLFSKALLLEASAKPSEEVFVGGDAQAALVVYTGEADAAASYWAPPQADGSLGDARASLLKAYPDIAEVVRILRLSDPIPYEPVVFRQGLPDEVRDRLVAALLSLRESEDGQKALARLCEIGSLVPASDRDYDIVRKMAATLGLDYAQVPLMR